MFLIEENDTNPDKDDNISGSIQFFLFDILQSTLFRFIHCFFCA